MVQAARGRLGGADVRGHVSRLQVPGPRTPPRQLWRAALQGEVSDCKYHILALHTVTIDTQEKNLSSSKLLENCGNYRKMAQDRFFITLDYHFSHNKFIHQVSKLHILFF